MKTATILNAYAVARDMRFGINHKKRDRQAMRFRAALLARIEAGDRAREALKLAAEAYRANEGGALDVILRWGVDKL